MINLPAIYIANATGILLMILLLLSSHKTFHYLLFDEKAFYIMEIMTILLCIMETISFSIDGRSFYGAHTLALIINSSLYIINIIFAFTWILYADFKLFEDRSRLINRYSLLSIPAFCIVIFSFINIFRPVFFRITSANVYVRTKFFLVPYITTYLYLSYGVILIYTYRNKVKKYLFLPAIVFMVPILLGSLLQYLFYGISLGWLGAAVALVSLYINVQNESTYIDSLSGLFTRQYLMNYLHSETKKHTSDTLLTGIMLDIDQFKKINDQFGHLIGDEAIVSAGNLLRSSIIGNGFAVRYAGDEFILILPMKEEKELFQTIEEIRKNTEIFNSFHGHSYTLQFSMGYSIYDKTVDSIDDFLRRMDEAMYQEKKEKVKMNLLPDRCLLP